MPAHLSNLHTRILFSTAGTETSTRTLMFMYIRGLELS